MSAERPTLLERLGEAGASATSLEGRSSRARRIATFSSAATVALAVAVGVRLAQFGVELGYATITPALARRSGP